MKFSGGCLTPACTRFHCAMRAATDYGDEWFDGDLAQFAGAVEALGGRCVYVSSRLLKIEDLLTDVDGMRCENSDGDEVASAGPASPPPELREFEQYIGAHCTHHLRIADGRGRLDYLVPAPWWDRLREVRTRAATARHGERAAAAAKLQHEQEQRRVALVEQLRNLISDTQFIQQSTQIAMQVYAVEKLPALEELGDRLLKTEIQAMDAKIKARGLRAKKQQTPRAKTSAEPADRDGTE